MATKSIEVHWIHAILPRHREHGRARREKPSRIGPTQEAINKILRLAGETELP